MFVLGIIAGINNVLLESTTLLSGQHYVIGRLLASSMQGIASVCVLSVIGVLVNRDRCMCL